MSNNKEIDTSTTAGKIAVMQAHEGGKKIQALFVAPNTEWHDSPHPSWDWANFDYRIKPEPKVIWVVSWFYNGVDVEHTLHFHSLEGARDFIKGTLCRSDTHSYKIDKYVEELQS